jgi:hypothetical protein
VSAGCGQARGRTVSLQVGPTQQLRLRVVTAQVVRGLAGQNGRTVGVVIVRNLTDDVVTHVAVRGVLRSASGSALVRSTSPQVVPVGAEALFVVGLPRWASHTPTPTFTVRVRGLRGDGPAVRLPSAVTGVSYLGRAGGACVVGGTWRRGRGRQTRDEQVVFVSFSGQKVVGLWTRAAPRPTDQRPTPRFQLVIDSAARCPSAVTRTRAFVQFRPANLPAR